MRPSPIISRNLLSLFVFQTPCCSFHLPLTISEEKCICNFLEALPRGCRKLKNVTKLLYLRPSTSFPDAHSG